jgi:hypothetical protein
MPPMRALAAVLALVSLQCAAAPFSLPVGDTRLGIDLPAGFADTAFTGSPRLQELAETLTSASNRILVFALTDADLRRFSAGDPPELRQYLLAVTPRALEHQRVTPAAFDAYVRDGLRSLGTAPGEGTDFLKHLEARPSGEPTMLAELRREPDAVAVLRGVRIPPADSGFFSFAKPSSYVLSTTSLVLLRGKALTLTVVTGYENTGDVEWIRATTLRWIDELRRLNTSR